jgi:ATP dependent DNA ligase domain
MAAALPRITPLAVKRRAAAFDNDGWLFELKYDGFRALLEIDDASAGLLSRNRNRFKHLDTLAAALAKLLRVNDAILDGEIICADETGRPIFIEMLRGRHPVCFVAFAGSRARTCARCRSSRGRNGCGVCCGGAPITSSRRCWRPRGAAGRSWRRSRSLISKASSQNAKSMLNRAYSQREWRRELVNRDRRTIRAAISPAELLARPLISIPRRRNWRRSRSRGRRSGCSDRLTPVTALHLPLEPLDDTAFSRQRFFDKAAPARRRRPPFRLPPLGCVGS